jgi:uncharacterized protein (DUF305 family)
MKIHRTFSLSALTFAGVLALSACADDGDTGPGSGSPGETGSTQEAAADFNEADIEFASTMVPHHQQAIMMSQIAVDQGGPEVAALAERIRAAQGTEIDTMTQWLDEWGGDTPMGMGEMDMQTHDMSDMDMGGMRMEGMMSAEDMQALMDSQGEEFDTMWLEMMIEHHEGAITMTQRQQADGANSEAVDLAGTMEQDQAAEIAEMEDLLQQSSGD